MDINTSIYYRAWGADNIAYGPVELPGLVAWIKQGKVRADSWVFREKDNTWARTSDLSELKVLFKSKLPPAAAAAADAMASNRARCAESKCWPTLRNVCWRRC